MSYYRDTATALAQRAAGNFIGVVLYVPPRRQSTSPSWTVYSFPRSSALEEWYTEIAPSAPLYYYLAAFDKIRSTLPVGESIAPPKPGQPGFDLHATGRWRPSPFNRPTVSGSMTMTSGERAAGIAKTIGLFALFAIPVGILLSTTQDRKQLQAEKAAFRRSGLDWEQRARR